jgi:hypothetical protein
MLRQPRPTGTPRPLQPATPDNINVVADPAVSVRQRRTFPVRLVQRGLENHLRQHLAQIGPVGAWKLPQPAVAARHTPYIRIHTDAITSSSFTGRHGCQLAG